MTNSEALKAVIAFPVMANVITKALLDHNIAPEEDYTASNKEKVNLAAIDVLFHVKQLSSFAEGDMAIGISAAEIDSQILALQGSDTAQQPKIRNASFQW